MNSIDMRQIESATKQNKFRMNNKLLNIFNKDIDVQNMIKSFLKRNETIQDLQGRSGSLSDIDLSKNKTPFKRNQIDKLRSYLSPIPDQVRRNPQ